MVEHGEVGAAKRGDAVDGGKEQIEVAVVVVVTRGGGGVGLLVKHATLSLIVEVVAARGAEVAEKTALGLVAAAVHMGEVSRKEIEVTVVVEVCPARPDRVPALKAWGRGKGLDIRGNINKVCRAVVAPQPVGLEAVVGDIEIQAAASVVVAGCDAPRAVLVIAPRQREALTFLVE